MENWKIKWLLASKKINLVPKMLLLEPETVRVPFQVWCKPSTEGEGKQKFALFQSDPS